MGRKGKASGGINESTLEVTDDGVNRMLTAKLVLALAALMTKFEVSSARYKPMVTVEAAISANLKIEDFGVKCMIRRGCSQDPLLAVACWQLS